MVLCYSNISSLDVTMLHFPVSSKVIYWMCDVLPAIKLVFYCFHCCMPMPSSLSERYLTAAICAAVGDEDWVIYGCLFLGWFVWCYFAIGSVRSAAQQTIETETSDRNSTMISNLKKRISILSALTLWIKGLSWQSCDCWKSGKINPDCFSEIYFFMLCLNEMSFMVNLSC